MITDSMLKKAAAASADTYMKAVDKKYSDQPNYIFSADFERKIAKLKRKANHPILYRPLYRAASIILALLLGSGVWLAFDTSARAALFGWIKDTYEHYFVYNYEGDNADTANNGITHYELTWIPEGYNLYRVDGLPHVMTYTYANEEGLLYKLNYTNNGNSYFLVNKDIMIEEKVTVNGIPADIYISSDPDVSNTIVWKVGKTIFAVDGFLDKGDLIKAAESVKEVKK